VGARVPVKENAAATGGAPGRPVPTRAAWSVALLPAPVRRPARGGGGGAESGARPDEAGPPHAPHVHALPAGAVRAGPVVHLIPGAASVK